MDLHQEWEHTLYGSVQVPYTVDNMKQSPFVLFNPIQNILLGGSRACLCHISRSTGSCDTALSS